ncbi:SDR family oxidoreductase [Oceanomicrobium pacificus]|uniref:SDR family oxidoreductase n=1 Tax=Oceanomicrobium pacificus TaxID=2692916 RepID=A0A6B0TZ29_9RHOB|nr:SDR family oxidoreductase [Oceanomicrobium pacificus]MXU64161.1 SDR family oxidoreductase [Oceanomicrobium pacificus]
MAQNPYLQALFGLEGRVALVTGGSSGIGRMIAEALTAAGARVLIASRKGERCVAVANEINAQGGPGQAEGFAGDVGSEAAIDALGVALRDRTDRLDILVNNAGISWGAPLDSFPHAQWARIFEVNVAGLFTLTRNSLPLLGAAATPDHPARVVNLGSVMGTVPVTEGAWSYTMSKAAVHHMTRALAAELAPRHITCNALAPGPFPSKMTAFATGTDAGAARVGANVPLGRIGRPADIAAAMLYLCGAGGSYVSGAILPVDGGMSAEVPTKLFANTLD